MRRLGRKQGPEVSEKVRNLIESTDPDVLEKALEQFAAEKRLQEIEDEINAIGVKRAQLTAVATKLTHERETLLGEDLSATPGCVHAIG